MNSTLGLYIHIPFCRARCSYCDFNIYAGMRRLYEPYTQAMCTEVERVGQALGRPGVSTVYFGGGTPSLLPNPLLAQLMDSIRAAFDVDSEAELSLEANPGQLEQASLDGLRQMGINRLSLGVQSSHADELTLLRRDHTFADAVEAFHLARAAGFANLNADLIYGLPNQTQERWQATLESVLALEPTHLSLYALSVEKRTTLELWIRRGKTPPPDDDLAADMVLWADDRLAQAGYARYEISNWAREEEFASRHNLIYWCALPYLGLGAGAHSYFDRRRFWNVTHPRDYIERITTGQPAWNGEEHIGPEMEMAEVMFLGLRLAQGVEQARFFSRFGISMFERYAREIERNRQAGLLEVDEQGIRLTRQGWLLGNRVFADFLPE